MIRNHLNLQTLVLGSGLQATGYKVSYTRSIGRFFSSAPADADVWKRAPRLSREFDRSGVSKLARDCIVA
jgi:hypothetical protein